jgi:hypothetical protein
MLMADKTQSGDEALQWLLCRCAGSLGQGSRAVVCHMSDIDMRMYIL